MTEQKPTTSAFVTAADAEGKPSAPPSLKKKAEHFVEGLIFGSRWLQAPLYAGLIVAELVYAYKFAVELWHLLTHATVWSEELVMISVLSLVDVTMVANLIAMIVIGGYATFVSRLNVEEHEDRPDWLEKIDAATMKIKLAASLVGISSIHLLKAFIDIEKKNPEHVKIQIVIHAMFLISSVMLALSERILHGPPHHAEAH